MALHHPGQFSLHRLVQVAAVPDEPEPSSRSEDAVDLGQGFLAPEPVKGLGDGHSVGRSVGERHLFRRPLDYLSRRDHRTEYFSHSLDRLDGDYPCTAREQEPGQLPGAGGQVDNGGIAVYTERLYEPGDGGRRVIGPPFFIVVRFGAESQCFRSDVHLANSCGVTQRTASLVPCAPSS